jgi:hypothetical protein
VEMESVKKDVNVIKVNFKKINKGWTNKDCSIRIIPSLGNNLPFGLQFPNENYYKDDKFRDRHPIFNVSVVSNIYLNVNISDLLKIIQPGRYINLL